MKSRVDIILIEVNLLRRICNPEIPDVPPVATLGRRIEGGRHGNLVLLVQVVVERSSIAILMQMRRGIHHITTLVFAFDKTDGGEKQTIDESPYPTREYQDEMVV